MLDLKQAAIDVARLLSDSFQTAVGTEDITIISYAGQNCIIRFNPRSDHNTSYPDPRDCYEPAVELYEVDIQKEQVRFMREV